MHLLITQARQQPRSSESERKRKKEKERETCFKSLPCAGALSSRLQCELLELFLSELSRTCTPDASPFVPYSETTTCIPQFGEKAHRSDRWALAKTCLGLLLSQMRPHCHYRAFFRILSLRGETLDGSNVPHHFYKVLRRPLVRKSELHGYLTN